MLSAKPLFSYRKYWARRFGVAPFLPMSREEMDLLGWDSCDIILVTGDAYVDHPSFGMAIIGRLLEAQGFRVGILSQPDWSDASHFTALGKPNLFFGVTAGNMDSMVNRYTADRRIRRDDAYTPDDQGGKRPDRSVIVYAQRCREAYRDTPIIIGGIEASLRRIAHYDYWSDKVRRSVLFDSRADMLVYGNAERAIVEIAHRIAKGERPSEMQDIRGTAFIRDAVPANWRVVAADSIDDPDPASVVSLVDEARRRGLAPRELLSNGPDQAGAKNIHGRPISAPPSSTPNASVPACSFGTAVQDNAIEAPESEVALVVEAVVVRMPAYDQVKDDPALYAQGSRVLHQESNPGNARPLVQKHGDRELWLNPPPIPLTMAEMDGIYDLPYARSPHPEYGEAKIPAWDMIRFSVNIMRGCFGGCSFCSITEHEGRIIQSRSEGSILREIEDIRDRVKGFTGQITDLGGPTANMYRMACKDEKTESVCRRLSCVFPSICKNLNTDHAPLISLYQKARAIPGIKKISIQSGLRYDLAVRSPEYVRELVTHHVGGYLKIAPEHTEAGPLSKMMKPGMGAYDEFKALFDKFAKEAGKELYLIPYFIAAHPGTTDEDMMNLAMWLKQNRYRADQVQTFLPSPMSLSAAMYHSERDPLRPVRRSSSDRVFSAKGLKQRRLHKAFLRYHDPENWPVLREALKRMGRADLIGPGKHQLVPSGQPGGGHRDSRGVRPGSFFTQQTNQSRRPGYNKTRP